jgi:hypothetical protein
MASRELSKNRTSVATESRVARLYILKPKIPIWVNIGGSCSGTRWYMLWSFGQFSGYLVYFVAIWYIFPRFGILYQEKSGNPD